MTLYLCFISYDDGNVNGDSFILYQTEDEANFWKKVIKKSYRDDQTNIVPIETEPKFGIKQESKI